MRDTSKPANGNRQDKTVITRDGRCGKKDLARLGGVELNCEDLGGGYGSAGMRPERRLSGRKGEGGVAIPAVSSASLSGAKALNPGSARAEPSQSKEPPFPINVLIIATARFGAPTFRAALEYVAMMEQPVEHGAHCRNVGQQLAPVIHRTVRSQQRTGAFVTAHHDLQQILGGGLRQLAHAEIVDDQQGDTLEMDSIYCLRVPSRVASATSSSRMCVWR